MIMLICIGGQIPMMNWETKMRIVVGVAHGIAYLHEYCKPIAYRSSFIIYSFSCLDVNSFLSWLWMMEFSLISSYRSSQNNAQGYQGIEHSFGWHIWSTCMASLGFIIITKWILVSISFICPYVDEILVSNVFFLFTSVRFWTCKTSIRYQYTYDNLCHGNLWVRCRCFHFPNFQSIDLCDSLVS